MLFIVCIFCFFSTLSCVLIIVHSMLALRIAGHLTLGLSLLLLLLLGISFTSFNYYTHITCLYFNSSLLIIVAKKCVSEAVLATDRAEHGTKQQFLSCCIMAKILC